MKTPSFLLVCCAAIQVASAEPLQIRVATFNASLNRGSQGQLVSNLSTTTNAQAKRVAEIIQRVRPDILLINEFDYDSAGDALRLFHDNYLALPQNGQSPLNYPYRYSAPSNTGESAGKDLDNNGSVTTTPGSEAYGNDSFGFGLFPGQYGMAVFSRFPIDTTKVRTFRKFLWKDMPGAVLPDLSTTPAALDWYSADELGVFRLSSKSHWDVPVEVGPGQIVHLLASHPTPPTFDGAEDRNGRRNHDEIRLWSDYVSNADYIYDDTGVRGGLGTEQRFVILGDLNADPHDGDSFASAIKQVLSHPLVNASVVPSSAGASSASASQGGSNSAHKGDPECDTADFFDGSGGAGNLRVDHVLPSRLGLTPVAGGVFWPLSSEATYSLVHPPSNSSDHRMVWLDLIVVPVVSQAVNGLEASPKGEDVVVTWRTQAGVHYGIEQSHDLRNWSEAPQVRLTLDANGNTARAVDPGATIHPRRFYRVTCTLQSQ